MTDFRGTAWIALVAVSCAIALGAPRSAIAQTGFEDSKGESSIILRRGSIAKFNITDARLAIGFASAPAEDKAGVIRWGLELSGKAQNGAAAIFSGDEVSPEVRGRFSFGRQRLFSAKPGQPVGGLVDDWAGLELGVSSANLVLVRSVPDRRVDTTYFGGMSFRGYYNAIPKFFNGIVGISLGAEKSSNYGSLKKLEYREDVSSRSGDTVRVLSSTVTGKSGQLQTGWAAKAAVDVVWIPRALGGVIGASLFGRLDDHSFVSPKARWGTGLIVTKEDRPSEVIGALTFSFGKQSQVGLVTGFSF